MKVALLGCGAQGQAIAFDLAHNNHQVIAIDREPNVYGSLKKFPKRITNNITTKTCDVEDKHKLLPIIKDADLLISALPGRYGKHVWGFALEVKKNLVDISYTDEDPFSWHREAQKRAIKIVVDAGFAPGLSNILVGNAYRTLASIEEIKIYTGGLPQKPKLPLRYSLTWSLEDLIEEYTRPARIVQNYKIIKVPALSGVETLEVPRIGKVECFYTDGLRTLLKTIKNVKNLEEKTIRYPGHAALISELLNYGYPYHKKSNRVMPKDFIVTFLRDHLATNSVQDCSILTIKIKTRHKRQTYFCLDFYDKHTKITSMARLTGFTASIVAQHLNRYNRVGVVPPEYFGMDPELYEIFLKEFTRRKINIKISGEWIK
ncbi:MAG: saccharopine dehydrogenase C-terminal domain-containing protein [candidate division WOR-3 bacterium]